MAIETRAFEASTQWLAGYAVNSAWQVPVVAVIGLVGARAARRLGPVMVHRVWAGALLAATVLPAVSGSGWVGWRGWFSSVQAGNGTVQVLTSSGAAGESVGFHWAPWALQAVCLVYAAFVLLGLLRLGLGLLQVRRLRQAAVPLPADALPGMDRLPKGVVVAEAAGVAGPMVVGFRPAWVLLPMGFAEWVKPEDAEAAIAHEAAHIARNDYAKNLLYRCVALPVAWHPCVWMMQARLAESREMICDAIAARSMSSVSQQARARYVRSLLRLAAALPAALPDGPPAAAAMAVGMLNGNKDGNRLERRVTQMMQTKKEVNRVGKAAVVAGLLLMTAVAGATVGGMHLNVQGDVQGDVQGAQPATRTSLTIPGKVMAGNTLTKVEPIYPAKAKQDKVQGKVILSLLIDKQGIPTDVIVKQGVRADLDESALTAVRQWRYKPYLLNGDPIAVHTTVNVTYTLDK